MCHLILQGKSLQNIYLNAVEKVSIQKIRLVLHTVDDLNKFGEEYIESFARQYVKHFTSEIPSLTTDMQVQLLLGEIYLEQECYHQALNSYEFFMQLLVLNGIQDYKKYELWPI
jgi:hypothetical protein